MLNERYKYMISVLENELMPAMGCTEPVSVAYAASLAKKNLLESPDKIEVCVSSDIIKNVKSVIVPNTNGMKGIESAVAAGFVAGNPDKELEVIAEMDRSQIQQIKEFKDKTIIIVSESDSGCIFDIHMKATSKNHSSSVRIMGHHTNVVSLKKDGKELISEFDGVDLADRFRSIESIYDLSVEEIIRFANEVDIKDVEKCLSQQIDYNMAIARAGMTEEWGAQIGKTLMDFYGDSISNRAKAFAAAGSDARMSGCNLPVVINSGSGNQGITASVPVVIYADEIGVSKDKLYRALIVSNLITIHLKSGIGCLSAYCGATSAGCGAAAGIAYLYGGNFEIISHAIVNALAINSGVVCDGAKPSCAAKIASSIESGLLGFQMARLGREFFDGEGIVKKGVENTINSVSKLARVGMKETDREIIRLMID